MLQGDAGDAYEQGPPVDTGNVYVRNSGSDSSSDSSGFGTSATTTPCGSQDSSPASGLTVWAQASDIMATQGRVADVVDAWNYVCSGSDEAQAQEEPCPFPRQAVSLSLVRFEEPQALRGAPDLVQAQDPVQAQVAKAESIYTENLEEHLAELTKEGKRLEVTHTASPKEVRQHLQRWDGSIKKELSNLKDPERVVAHTGEDAARILARPDVVVIHCKGVFTVKPDPENLYKRKCRIVACGNESKETDADSLYASGIPADILRASLTEASARAWSVGVTDIHAAFLQAPMPESGSSRYILKPPRWLIEGGYIPPSEIWTLKKVLYGFRESPARWSSYRDKCLSTLELSHAGIKYRLRQSQTDSSLWRVEPVGQGAATASSSLSGLLLTYVDDLLFLGPPDLCTALYGQIMDSFGWNLDPLQFVGPEQRIKFLGMEVMSLPI